MQKICVASHHPSLEALLTDSEFKELAKDPRMLVELRLDQYKDLSTAALRTTLRALGPERLVVTFRCHEEGGGHPEADDTLRLKYLLLAVEAGAAYIDFEWRTLERCVEFSSRLMEKRSGQAVPKFIVSFHDFEGVPSLETLRDLRQKMEASCADVVKVAVRPSRLLDALPLLKLMRETDSQFKKPFLALAMGEAGFWSRVLGPLFPNPAPFTFARGEGAPGTAPGQPTWRELAEMYRFGELQADWPVFGVVGNPIAHSRSPLMHNAALANTHTAGVYLPFKLDGDPVAFVRDFAPLIHLQGISVTIPHKEAILPACDEVSAVARRIGAVNTLVKRRDSDQWFATNTDAEAAAGSLEEALGGKGRLTGKVVLILGAGGAARALAFGVKDKGAEVWIHNRTRERAEKLAQEVAARCVDKEAIVSQAAQITAVVNTTPLGMHPNVEASPLEEKEIPKGSVVFDTVYNPLRTKLLQLASQRGCSTLPGLQMFVGQGAEQFRLFTGKDAPLVVMKVAMEAAAAPGE